MSINIRMIFSVVLVALRITSTAAGIYLCVSAGSFAHDFAALLSLGLIVIALISLSTAYSNNMRARLRV